MTSAVFWDITQSRVIILYRRFGKTYQSHLQGSRNPRIRQEMCVTVARRKIPVSFLLTPALTLTLGHAECHVGLDEDLPGGQSDQSKEIPNNEV